MRGFLVHFWLFLVLSSYSFVILLIQLLDSSWILSLVSTIISSRSFLHHHDLQESPNWSPYFQLKYENICAMCSSLFQDYLVCVCAHLLEIFSLMKICILIGLYHWKKENAFPLGNLEGLGGLTDCLPYCWLPTDLIVSWECQVLTLP